MNDKRLFSLGIVGFAAVLSTLGLPLASGAVETGERDGEELLADEIRLKADGEKAVTVSLEEGEILEIRAYVDFPKVAGYTPALEVYLDGRKLTEPLGREKSFEIADGRSLKQRSADGWQVPIAPGIEAFEQAPGLYAPMNPVFDPSELRFLIAEDYSDGVELKIMAGFNPQHFYELVIPSVRALPGKED